MSSSLCQVASFLNVAEAEWARCRLGFEGIRARLGNANVLLWCWHWSNASGGVRVFVHPNEAEQARQILTAPRLCVEGDSWRCAECGEEGLGGWKVCWRCGTAREEAVDLSDVESPTAISESSSQPVRDATPWIGVVHVFVAAAVGLSVYGFTRDWLFGLAGCLAGLCFGSLLGYLFGHVDGVVEPSCDADLGPEPEPVLSAAEQSQRRRQQLGNYLAIRAWQTTLFSVVWFSPLVFCAIGTLLRIQPRRMLLRPSDWLHYCGSWCLSMLVFLGWFVFSLWLFAEA